MKKHNYPKIPKSLLDVFKNQVKNAPSPSIALLKRIGSLSNSYGYGTTLEEHQDLLYKQLARERDFLLGKITWSEEDKNRLTEYVYICTSEFQEFALLDEVILSYIADLKLAVRRTRRVPKSYKKLLPKARQLISGVLDPIFPKSQGYRGVPALPPIGIRIKSKHIYEKILETLQDRLKHANRQRNFNSRSLSIKEVVRESFRTNNRSVRSSEIDEFADKYRRSASNKIALELVAWMLGINSSALHKALRSK